MREILFRGKHAISGEWIYGDLLCSKGNYYIHKSGEPVVVYASTAFETVGQYTGLKDKSGVKIFEGDIVRYAYLDEYRCYLESLESPEDYEGCNFDNMWTIDVVVCCINIGYPAFDLNRNDWEVNGLSNLSESTEYYFEVIGNVHDNPELLEVKKMKNKEKFAKEILDIVCNGDVVAMDKDRMKLQVCGGTECEDCYFCRVTYPNNTGDCMRNFAHWVDSEYKEKKEFSEADKLYVKALDKLNWFARDKNGVVYGYVNKPFRNVTVWDVKAGGDVEYAVERVSSYSSATFEPLSWDDDEPTHRDEILGVK